MATQLNLARQHNKKGSLVNNGRKTKKAGTKVLNTQQPIPKMSQDEFLNQQKLDLMSFNTEESSWELDADRLDRMCKKQMRGWHDEIVELKNKAVSLYKREVWERMVEGKVDDRSSYPSLTVDEHFGERHLEISIDTVGQLLLDATKCSIDTNSDKGEWKILLDGSTRAVVEKLQNKTNTLIEFIRNAEPRLSALNKSTLRNTTFAQQTLQQAREAMEKQMEFDRARQNNLASNIESWQLTAEDRETINNEQSEGSGTGEHTPATVHLDDTNALGELGEVGEGGAMRAPGGTALAPPPNTPMTRITPTTTTMVSPSITTVSFGGSRSPPATGGLLGLKSLQNSLNSVVGEGAPIILGNNLTNNTSAWAGVNTGGERIIQSTSIKVLQHVNPETCQQWLNQNCSLSDNTGPDQWLSSVSEGVRRTFRWMAQKEGSVWRGWETWPLHQFKRTMEEHIVKPRTDRFANTLQEAFKGVTYSINTPITDYGLAASAQGVLEKLDRFDNAIKTAESTPEGRKQLFNVLGTVVQKGVYQTDKGEKAPTGKSVRSPAEENTAAIRNTVVQKVTARTALPHTNPAHVKTGLGYMLAVEQEFLLLADNYLMAPEVYNEFSGVQGKRTYLQATHTEEKGPKRPKIDKPVKQKCQNPNCGKWHDGECRTPWPNQDQGQGGKYQGRGQHPPHKPTLGMQHNNAEQQSRLAHRGQVIHKQQEKLNTYKNTLHNPVVKKALAAIKKGDMSSADDWKALRAMIENDKKLGSDNSDA